MFDEIGDELTASAGSSLSIRVNAKAQLEEDEITYSARTLPRGASFDPATATVMWKPTSSQIGDNLFAIDAKDEAGRLSTLYFTVKVYGSTTGGEAEALLRPHREQAHRLSPQQSLMRRTTLRPQQTM